MWQATSQKNEKWAPRHYRGKSPMRRSRSAKRASGRSASNCGSMASSVICGSRSAKALSRFSKASGLLPQVGINDGETVRTDISFRADYCWSRANWRLLSPVAALAPRGELPLQGLHFREHILRFLAGQEARLRFLGDGVIVPSEDGVQLSQTLVVQGEIGAHLVHFLELREGIFVTPRPLEGYACEGLDVGGERIQLHGSSHLRDGFFVAAER